MLYVLWSVCCSVIVTIVIKLAKKRDINVQQLVLWNYPVTVVATYFLLDPVLSDLSVGSLPWSLYIPLAMLLPVLFIFIAFSVRYSGIVKTDIAQRMSIFIPLIAAFLLFGEVLEPKRLIGITVGLVAVLCSVGWTRSGQKPLREKSTLFPLLVFVGMGIIDILFKQVAQDQHILYKNALFIVFTMAMIMAFILLLNNVCIKKEKFDRHAIYWGLLLGAFNFGNIYLYMKAHRALPDNPSIVFTTMNIGVIVLGGLVGILIFNEKLSVVNKLGLGLAVVSIVLIKYL